MFKVMPLLFFGKWTLDMSTYLLIFKKKAVRDVITTKDLHVIYINDSALTLFVDHLIILSKYKVKKILVNCLQSLKSSKDVLNS